MDRTDPMRLRPEALDGAGALEAAREREEDIVRFLREMIAIPAESRQEGERCERVRREYEALGFDEVFFDRLGNVVGRLGDGPLTILMDGHIDCVGVGDPGAWAFDPFQGKLEDGEVWGRDQGSGWRRGAQVPHAEQPDDDRQRDVGDEL